MHQMTALQEGPKEHRPQAHLAQEALHHLPHVAVIRQRLCQQVVQLHQPAGKGTSAATAGVHSSTNPSKQLLLRQHLQTTRHSKVVPSLLTA